MTDIKIDDLDEEIVEVQAMFDGSTLVPIALALALLDAGVLKRDGLLEIIESLQAILEFDYELKLGSIESAETGLVRLRDYLLAGDWRPGRVVAELRLHEASEQGHSLLRKTISKPEG